VVTIVEGKNYPFYSVQFHPEKDIFDYQMPKMPHYKEARQFTEDLLWFFVNESRKSEHKFESYEKEVEEYINKDLHLVSPDQGLFDKYVFDFYKQDNSFW